MPTTQVTWDKKTQSIANKRTETLVTDHWNEKLDRVPHIKG